MRSGHRVCAAAARGRATAKLPRAAELPAAEGLVRFATITNDVARAPHLFTRRRVDLERLVRVGGALGSGNVVRRVDGLRPGGAGGRRALRGRNTARPAVSARQRAAGRRLLGLGDWARLAPTRRSRRTWPGTERGRAGAKVACRGLVGRDPHARLRKPVRPQQGPSSGQNGAGEYEDRDLQFLLRPTNEHLG